ncbi:MAG: hypothetical protein ABJE95_31220 [Byssovorax sp.]
MHRTFALAASLAVLLASAPALAADPAAADVPQARPGALRLHAESASVTPVEIDLDAAPGDPAAIEIRRLRVAFFSVLPLPGLDVRLAGYTRLRQGIPGITAHSLDLFSLRYRLEVPLSTRGRLRLTLDGGGTFSLVQALAVDGVAPDLRPCASQSDLFGTIGLDYDAVLAAAMFAQAHGDPFHVGSGDDCIGRGSLWESGDAVGAHVRARAGRGVEIDATLQRDRYLITHHDQAGTARLGDVAGAMSVRIALP